MYLRGNERRLISAVNAANTHNNWSWARMEARNCELSLGLPCGWQEPKSLRQHLPASQGAHLAGSWTWEPELGAELKVCDVGRRHLTP